MSDRVHVVGIDVGGTFIDYVGLTSGKPIRVHKSLNRPDDVAGAILDGLAAIAASGVAEVIHGTTVATNAIIERRGSRVALVATEGFADVIEIGRQDRPNLYALEGTRPEPLVSRDDRFEVDERVGARGEVIRGLDVDAAREIAERICRGSYDSAAVCLLFSFLNPEHEQVVAAALRRAGVHFVTASTDVISEHREYERTTTTVANGYVSPLLGNYLGTLSDGLVQRFGVERFEVMQSNAGVLSGDEAARQGARMLLSGPAGGVAGSFDLARRHAVERIITFDMGGTSTDVALCDGSIPATVERDVSGIPIRLPMVDIETVGAGGGSIARVDSGGALRVGPDSAGAVPGPACFGSGTLATVTDAQAVCGLLDVSSFLGGSLQLDIGRARQVIEELGRQMSATAEVAAEGVLAVANVSIEQAIRRISVERGYDPRDFTLVAFGGAGPLHACSVAEGLGIERLLIPAFPGVMSAVGMAQADAVRDFSQSMMGRNSVEDVWRALEDRAAAALPGGTATRSIDCRYKGQGYELEVQVASLDGLEDEFHAAHLRRFGFEDRGRELEIVTARIRMRRPRAVPRSVRANSTTPRTDRTTTIRWHGRAYEAPIIQRSTINDEGRCVGPALVVQADCAFLLAPGWSAAGSGDSTLIAERVS